MARPPIDREEMRQRILAKADKLFRQFGFHKTTVADIAAELKMSSANIYKFFASKDAIVEACAAANVAKLKVMVTQALRAPGTVLDRFERMVLGIYHFHRELLRNERQIFRIIVTAREENWSCILEFESFVTGALRELLEEGIRGKGARRENFAVTAAALNDALNVAFHPHLRHNYDPNESEARVRAHIRLLQRALQ